MPVDAADDTAAVERRAWNAYAGVRDAVVAMQRAAASGVAAPSAYWSDELANIDFMAEATPRVIARLRQHAFWITGLRAYDYRTRDDERYALFEGRLRALVDLGGSDLVVPEADALGGFGYRIDGGLHNLDTLKFLEVLVGLRRAGIFDPLRAASSARAGGAAAARPVIVEVGGGWGGLAYQYKTLVPGTTYVIVDLPEMFLFSAVYLTALFPDARHVLWGADAAAASRWRDADFVYVPNASAEAIRAFAPSLLVNVASFQEMTDAQVDAYASLSAAAGCPALYSLNRERSRHNTQLTGISQALSRAYDLRTVDVLDTDYTQAMKKPSKAKKKKTGGAPEDPLLYRHLAGQLRRVQAGRIQ